jgi:hypothetical protein
VDGFFKNDDDFSVMAFNDIGKIAKSEGYLGPNEQVM